MKHLTLNLDTDDFLANYWQKKPLLIRNAFDAFQLPITAEELAGLACEEGIESRLVLEKGGSTPWEVRHGPFSETDFTTLPDSYWTLLVQDVEKHLPELLPLLDVFDFIPAWRLDDLMISYATNQGSVGPHLDAYDVFLIQTQGRRHWNISSQFNEQSALLADIDLKILQDFIPEQDWILEPGDILYLPPNIAHHGIALNNCMTCSVGFRAPGISELIHSYTECVIQNLDLSEHFTDQNRTRQRYTHELDDSDIEKLKSWVLHQIEQPSPVIQHCLGTLLTESKENFIPFIPDKVLSKQEFLNLWETQGKLYRDTRLRFLFKQSPSCIDFYIDAAHISCVTADTVNPEYLCSVTQIDFKAGLHKQLTDLLYQFYQHGYYYLEQ